MYNMNLKNILINFSKALLKLDFLHISIYLLILIIFIFTYYQYSSTIPKKISIKGKVEKVLNDKYEIEEISGDKKIIKCQIDKNYFQEEKYKNYVLGEGQGRKINANILLKKGDEYYKLKTLLKDEDIEYFNLVSCVNDKYLSGDFEVLIYNNDNSNIYIYGEKE